MAQKPNDKRAQRMAKSDRSMNRAVILLMAGLIAEWYLLTVDRYYVRGTLGQMVGWYHFFGVMVWAGLGLLAAGIVLLVLRGGKPWLWKLGVALGAAGAFFAFSSAVMRHSYPTTVTAMCVLVPVLLIIGIVCLFYPAEFAFQAMGLAMALGAQVLLNRSSTVRVKASAILAIVGIAALLILSAALKKNGGVLGKGARSLRVIGANADYRPLFCVLALCLVLVVAALFAPAITFYGIWALALVALVLAVYYTIKLM